MREPFYRPRATDARDRGRRGRRRVQLSASRDMIFLHTPRERYKQENEIYTSALIKTKKNSSRLFPDNSISR